MFHSFRNARMATTAKFAGAVLIAASVSAGTAAADDISEVAVTNTGKLSVKVVILNTTGGEIGRTSGFITGNGGSGKVTLQKTVNKYHWEVFAKGPDGRQDVDVCDKKRDISTPSITVHCDYTKAEKKPAAAPAAAPPAVAAGQQQANKTIKASFSNLPPRPDDLKTMNLKESDVIMNIETTDKLAQKTESFSLPVGVKTIDLTTDASGNAHLSFKISFGDKVCFTGTVDGKLGATPAGKIGKVAVIQLTSNNPVSCAVQL
jgi:hypothetical protein